MAEYNFGNVILQALGNAQNIALARQGQQLEQDKFKAQQDQNMIQNNQWNKQFDFNKSNADRVYNLDVNKFNNDTQVQALNEFQKYSIADGIKLKDKGLNDNLQKQFVNGSVFTNMPSTNIIPANTSVNNGYGPAVNPNIPVQQSPFISVADRLGKMVNGNQNYILTELLRTYQGLQDSADNRINQRQISAGNNATQWAIAKMQDARQREEMDAKNVPYVVQYDAPGKTPYFKIVMGSRKGLGFNPGNFDSNGNTYRSSSILPANAIETMNQIKNWNNQDKVMLKNTLQQKLNKLDLAMRTIQNVNPGLAPSSNLDSIPPQAIENGGNIFKSLGGDRDLIREFNLKPGMTYKDLWDQIYSIKQQLNQLDSFLGQNQSIPNTNFFTRN